MTADQKKIYHQIDEILWRDWDPIGVNEFEDVRDEYSSYALQILGLKINNADKKTIAERLYKFELVDLEVAAAGSKQRCEEIAEKILAI